MNLCLVWSTFLLSFAHFSTIPAHALALFQSPHSGVVVSAIGFSDTMAYAVLSLLNATVMSDESGQTICFGALGYNFEKCYL